MTAFWVAAAVAAAEQMMLLQTDLLLDLVEMELISLELQALAVVEAVAAEHHQLRDRMLVAQAAMAACMAAAVDPAAARIQQQEIAARAVRAQY